MKDWNDEDAFQNFCSFHNINIKVVSNIGANVRGFCVYKKGRYNVFLNNRFDSIQLKKTLVHELIHVFENHFECETKEIDKCENEVSEILTNMKLNFKN